MPPAVPSIGMAERKKSGKSAHPVRCAVWPSVNFDGSFRYDLRDCSGATVDDAGMTDVSAADDTDKRPPHPATGKPAAAGQSIRSDSYLRRRLFC